MDAKPPFGVSCDSRQHLEATWMPLGCTATMLFTPVEEDPSCPPPLAPFWSSRPPLCVHNHAFHPLCPLRPPRSHPATRLHWPTSQPTEASKKNTIRVHLGQLPRGRDTMNEAGMGRCQQILFKDTDLDAGAGWKICRDTVHTPPNRRRSPRTSPVPFSASACLLRHPLPASPSPFFPPLCRSVALQMSSLPCRPLNCQGCSLCPDASPHIFP
ncbi:hypothetical protein B0J11DRAFT_187772 [Dendryphion nanum]|uniref:Uncharacterized protein n=1 Tax=Dendryphion nanum TaxID=256645 RepID=A0A9P9D3W5_9PLEO|nr:hypothetical protein B0J11DRAFT_187772 [Dendryphion nanum]